MKIRIVCKTPDCLDDAIEEAFSNEYGIDDAGSLEDLRAICSRWVKYGELVTIEIDTEKNTAQVLEVK